MSTNKSTSLRTRTSRALFSQEKDNNVFDVIARVALLVAVFFLPIFFLPIGGVLLDAGKSIFIAIVATLVFLFWLIGRLQEGNLTIPKSILLLFGGLVVFVFFLGSVFSPVFNVSMGGLTYENGTFISILSLFLILFLTSLLFQSIKNVIQLYTALFVSFVAVFLFQVIRIFAADGFLSFGIFFGKTANLIGKWNDLGIFAGLIVLFSLITLETLAATTRLRFILYGFLIAGLVLLAVVDFGPVWFLLGFLALGIFVYRLSFAKFQQSNIRNNLKREKTFPAAALLVLLLATLFLIGGSTISGFINNRLGIIQVEVRPSWGSTLVVFQETIKERPLLGSGPNRFVNQWLAFKPDSVNNSPFWNIDFRSGIGLLPTFAVTTGVVGVIALGLFLFYFISKGFRYLFSTTDVYMNYILFSSFTGALYLWIISFLYVPNPAVFFFAFLLTGVFVGALVRAKKVDTYTLSYFKNPRIGFVVVLALIVLIIGTTTSGYFISKKLFTIITFQKSRALFNAGGDLVAVERGINQALKYDAADIYYRALTEVKTQQLVALLSRQDLSIDEARIEFRDILGNAIRAGQGAVSYDNTQYLNWLALAQVYRSVVPAVSGAYENALASINQAVVLNPRSPALLLERARLEIANGNTAQARSALSESLSLKPDYVDAIFLLSQLDVSEGNIIEAIRSVEEATLYAPNNLGLFFQLGLLRHNQTEYRNAALAFERALSLDQNFSNAKYFLGLSYYQLNRIDDAITQFEDLKRLNPNNREVENILGNLKSGQDPFEESQNRSPFDENSELPLN